MKFTFEPVTPKPISITYMESVEEFVKLQDTYKLRRKNWLANFIIRKFVKWGWMEDNITVRHTSFREFSMDDLLELIHAQMRNYYAINNHMPKRVIVGHEQQVELFKEARPINGIVNLNVRGEAQDDEQSMVTVFGMTIEFNPLINGVVVLGE